MTVFEILIKYREGFAAGLFVTFKLCLSIWSIGLIIGVLLGVLSAKWRLWIGIPSRVFAFILSGIPVLVFLFWLHYPLQSMLGIIINPFYTATAAITIINIFLVAEIVRIALEEFPIQYLVAARVCGLTSIQTVWYIQFPLVFRQIIPGLLNTQVNMLQLTLFASLISVEEIFRVAQRVNASIYQPVEIYSTLAICFLIICLPLNGLAIFLKNRFTRNLSET